MMKFSDVFEGWRNDLFPPERLKDVISKAHEERIEICRKCEFDSRNAKEAGLYKSKRKDEHCIKCGCPLQKKTKCLSCECPLKKWLAVMTAQEEDKVYINHNQDGTDD